MSVLMVLSTTQSGTSQTLNNHEKSRTWVSKKGCQVHKCLVSTLAVPLHYMAGKFFKLAAVQGILLTKTLNLHFPLLFNYRQSRENQPLGKKQIIYLQM